MKKIKETDKDVPPEQTKLVCAELQNSSVDHGNYVDKEPAGLEKLAATYFFEVLVNCGLRLVAFNAEKKSSHTIES